MVKEIKSSGRSFQIDGGVLIKMSKKIFVPGGNGFLGKHVVKKLKDNNIDFISLSLRDGVDFRDFKQIKELFEKEKFDAAINCAAFVGAPACKKDRKTAEAINYQGTVNVDNARDDSQKLIYASTGSVYGKLKEVCTEESPTNPLSIYERTKLEAEKQAMKSGNVIVY